MLFLPINIYKQNHKTITISKSQNHRKKKSKDRESKRRPRSWKLAKGTMKRAGWRMRETKETIVDFMAFGDGRVKSRAITASAATTYVSIIHCNAIFLFFFLYSEDSFCVRFLLGLIWVLFFFLMLSLMTKSVTLWTVCVWVLPRLLELYFPYRLGRV